MGPLWILALRNRTLRMKVVIGLARQTFLCPQLAKGFCGEAWKKANVVARRSNAKKDCGAWVLDRLTREFVASHRNPDFPGRSPLIASGLSRAKAVWKVIIPNVLDIVRSAVAMTFWRFMQPAKQTPNVVRVKFVLAELVKKAKLRGKGSLARRQSVPRGSSVKKELVLRGKKRALHVPPTGNAKVVVCVEMQAKKAVAG